MDLLLSAGIRLKLSKCAFGVRTTDILGHVVDENGLRPSDRNVEAIRALTEPASRDELMRFLGLVNYFTVSVDHFSETAALLYEALKGTGFSKKRRRSQRLVISDCEQGWGKAHRGAWLELKTTLNNPDILAAPVRGAAKRVKADCYSNRKSGRVETDSIHQSVAAKGGTEPCPYGEGVLSNCPRPAEMATLLTRGTVHNGSGPPIPKMVAEPKGPQGKLARWVVAIQDFDLILKHRTGPELVVPNTLSRDAVPKPLCQRCYVPIDDSRLEKISEAAEVERVAAIVEGADMGTLYRGPSISELRSAQQEEFGDLNKYAASQKKMIVDDEGLLHSTRRDKLPVVVPTGRVTEVLTFVHGSRLTGH